MFAALLYRCQAIIVVKQQIERGNFGQPREPDVIVVRLWNVMSEWHVTAVCVCKGNVQWYSVVSLVSPVEGCLLWFRDQATRSV